MKRHVVIYLIFFCVVPPVFLYTVPAGYTLGINAELEALLHLGITDSSVDWRNAFGRLAERFKQKDVALKQLNVLNYIRSHMEILALQLDPVFYTLKGDSQSFVTLKRSDIPDSDIPLHFLGRLEADFKTAYIKWYRIIMNSKDSRIVDFVAAVKQALSDDKMTLTERDIAKGLAVIWCQVCNGIHSVMGGALGQINWQSADEVAAAYGAFQKDAFHVKFVRILFESTMFTDRVKT